MAKDKLTDYDSTASGNLDVGGISVAEGMLPSGVNNAIREQMSHLADFAAGTTGIDVLSLADDDASHAIKLQAPSAVTADTTFTLPDGDGASGQTMITDGAGTLAWAAPYGNRNLIINGAMQVAQRGTSFSQAGTPQYTIDRFEAGIGGSFDWNSTITQSSTAPAGFGSSLKVDVDTVSTPTSGQNAAFFYKIEAQDLQQLNFGTANAESFTLSFWVRSNKTGTYCLQIIQPDASKGLLYEYEISSADTWEKKTITFSGNTADQINNDNGQGLNLFWSLACGSGDHRSASTTWTADVGSGVRATSNQVNLMDNTANEWYLTGVQLEVGETATPFEHRSYGDELARCQRYYYENDNTYFNNVVSMHFSHPVPMRASPVITYTHSGSPVISNINTLGLLAYSASNNIGTMFANAEL